MELKGKILVAIILGLFAALVVWVVATTPDAPPPIDKLDPPSTMEYEGNTFTEERNGEKFFEITSGHMVVDVQTKNATFDDFAGKFYQRDGRVVEISAKRGSYNQQSGDIHIEGGVTVTDSDGSKLTSGALDWIGADEVLVATGDVKISKDDMRAFGDRAESRNGLHHFKLIGNARVLKGISDDSELENKQEDALEKFVRENFGGIKSN